MKQFTTKYGELWLGDCLETLKRLEAGSVSVCCTSPPYFRPPGLQDRHLGRRRPGV